MLNRLHTFGDPAMLRREMFDCRLIDRDPAGSSYWLDPDRPSLEDLCKKCCEQTSWKVSPWGTELSDSDLAGAEDFRNRIHAEALARVQLIHPGIPSVVDRYAVEDYFQRYWDYPGAWYTIVAIPESAKSREALIDTIVRDTIAKYR